MTRTCRQGSENLEEYSSQFDELHFQIALNYGSRDEIKRAVQDLAGDVKKGVLDPAQITEDTISGYLDTKGLPDPDLLIRTSGEERLSNFLMWQLATRSFILPMWHGRILTRLSLKRPFGNLIRETADTAA